MTSLRFHSRAFLGLTVAGITLAGCSPAIPTAAPEPASSAEPAAPEPAAPAAPEELEVKVLRELPFDSSIFTEGLEVEGEDIWISAGLEGKSALVRQRIPTSETELGAVTQRIELAPEYFGEGITRVGDAIWQVTYRAGKAFKYDAASLELLSTASYEGEGWGMCSFDDAEMYMSDGSDEIRLLNAEDFSEKGRIAVTLEGEPQRLINELSCAPDGWIYANVFTTDQILRIDPAEGKVTGVIDASALRPAETKSNNEAVLNGIAHIPGSDHFYLAGKLWPVMYEVQFAPRG